MMLPVPLPPKSRLPKRAFLWNSELYRDLGVAFGRGKKQVIKLTRINGDSVTVNSDLILFVEEAGETTITLANGERMKVQENIEVLCSRVLEFKRSVVNGSVYRVQECGS
jgi:uncharacterized protein YlzI (FlbEa/FlbD family)